MSPVINLADYVGASGSRLLVMVDLQDNRYEELTQDPSCDIELSLENCLSAIRHARANGVQLAFTRQACGPGVFERPPNSAWISGLEPRRSDMVFELQQPSCYSNRMFEDVVSRSRSFAIAGLSADGACLATAIDGLHRGHHVTFISDASVSRGRPDANARAVHALTTEAIQLFADVVATRHWLIATAQRVPEGHSYG
jgi:nicotinamidase-related amidase